MMYVEHVTVMGAPDWGTTTFCTLLKYKRAAYRWDLENYHVVTFRGFWKGLEISFSACFVFALESFSLLF